MIHYLKKIASSPVFFILLGQSMAGGILLWVMSGWVFPFTTDSILYITTALNLAYFKGLVSVNFFLQPPVPSILLTDILPMHLTPPGYSIGIACLKWLGINEYLSALVLPRLCFLFLPFLFFTVFKRIMTVNLALVASGLCILSFPVLTSSVIAWSDTPYLAISLLVLIMVFNISEKMGFSHWSYIFLAGILSGVAILFRYAGVSLVFSIVIGFMVMVIMKIMTGRDFVRILCLYGMGVALLLIPYFIRNIVVFGVVGVYPHSISQADFWAHMIVVAQLYFQGLSLMIFGVDSLILMIVALIVFFIFWFLRHATNLIKRDRVKFICLQFLVIYFFSYSIFLIYNKSMAFLAGNPDINERVLMQLFWLLLGGVVYAIYAGLKKWGFSQWWISIFAGSLIVLFIIVQFIPGVKFHQQHREIRNLAKSIMQYSFNGVPAGYMIVSNVPEITYLSSNRNVRALSGYTPADLLRVLAPYRKFVVFLVKGSAHLSPAWTFPGEWKNPPGYRKVYVDTQVEMLIPEESLAQ